MNANRTLIALQIATTFLVAALGTVALFDGRIVVGVLLFALASARGWMAPRAASSASGAHPPAPGRGGPEPLLNPPPFARPAP